MEKIKKELLDALAAGPSTSAFRGNYAVGLATQFGTTKLEFFDAWYTYYPDAGKPSYVLLWTPASAHVFEYHEVDYLYKGA